MEIITQMKMSKILMVKLKLSKKLEGKEINGLRNQK